MDEKAKREQERAARLEASAGITYTQALWYAWGRLDSGEYRGRKLRNPLDAFEFAGRVRREWLKFATEQTTHSESIQGQWDKYVASETP